MLNPPNNLSLDLKQYLDYMSKHISNIESRIGEIPRITDIPEKPILGKPYYFLNTVTPTITNEGVWIYKSTGWAYVG